MNSQSEVIYLHFYDEGLFYDGFYVINDLEVKERGGGARNGQTYNCTGQTEYEEVDGRVFIYNSDSDDCPDETGRNW